MEINWPSILAACTSTAAFFSGVGVGILSLFIDNKLHRAERRILEHFDTKFELKESVEYKLKEIKEDITEIRQRLEKR